MEICLYLFQPSTNILTEICWNRVVCLYKQRKEWECECDVLLCLQSVGNKNGKLWTTDEEVSPEVLAKVRGKHVCGIYFTSSPIRFFIFTSCMHIYNPVLMTEIQIYTHFCNRNQKIWCKDAGTSLCLITHALPVPPGAGHQAASALVTRNEEQPVQVSKLHPAPAVSHAGQRGRPHGAEEDQVTRRLKVTVQGHSGAVRGLRSSGGMCRRNS